MDDLLETRQTELHRHVTNTLSLKRVPSLKRMCRLRGIRVGGRKADLVTRLAADVLEKGWTVSTEADLWKDYSMIPDSPVESKKSKSARPKGASFSNLDDSDSGRSSPPSSVSGSPSSVSTLASAPDDSSVASVGEEAADQLPQFDEALLPVDGAEESSSGGRKRVALFVDDESPEQKRKKHLSEQSVDSGIHGPSRRPHMTRRALKANLRKASSRRSGTDYLSRSNVGVVLETIKNYAIREDGLSQQPVSAQVTKPSGREKQQKKKKEIEKFHEDVERDPEGLGVRDVIPVSVISCDSLSSNHGSSGLVASTTPDSDESISLIVDTFGDDITNSTSIVAAVTTPEGVPMAIVTTEPASNDGASHSSPVSRGFARSATPVIEWIRIENQ